MRKVYLILVVVIVLVLVFSFVKQSKIKTSSDKLQVAASFYPLYFFASQIGGDKVEVRNITPAGVEPHDYDPSTQDIARIEKDKMLILNGGVEAWGDKIKDNLKGKDVKVIIAGEGLLIKKDPHVWLSPNLARQEVAKITEGFITIDTVNESYYKGNEKKLDAKLDQLDSDYKKGLANCQSKDIITSHAAFAYLAEQYGLHQIAISGLSPDEEPSAQQLASVADFAKKHNVKYIFFESLVSPKLSETIASEVGAQTIVLDPIEGLSDDDIKQGKNYLTVMEANLKNLQTALQCSK